MQKEPNNPIFERHAQTILGAIIVALILWVGSSINQQSQQLVAMNEQIKSLQTQVTFLTKFAERPSYSRDDFKNDIRMYESQMNELMVDMKKLANYINDMNTRLVKVENNK